MAAMPVTQGDTQAYIDGLGLLTTANANAHTGAFVQEQRFVNAADTRQLRYATKDDVR